jgi:hypothetical protein
LGEALKANPTIRDFLDAFATVSGPHYIARNENSIDPWGQRLHIVKTKLVVRYKELEYPGKEHGDLAKCNRPQKPAMHAVNPHMYYNLRIRSVLPNFLNAIKAWQEENPTKDAIVGKNLFWGFSLGGDNVPLKRYLQSTKTIEASPIKEFARKACVESAICDHFFRSLRERMAERTTVTHPIPDPGNPDKKLEHAKKTTCGFKYRIIRAIVYEVSLCPLSNAALQILCRNSANSCCAVSPHGVSLQRRDVGID